jgi:electron transfer flavoprotein beta subunit
MESLIAVCLKAVLRTDTPLRLDSSGRRVLHDGRVPSLGPSDRAALGLARALRARLPGTRLLALTVGPPDWESLLREALAQGADEALRLAPPSGWREVDGSAEATRANAEAVAAALRPRAPVLVLTGDVSGDTGHGCFGAYLAHALGMAFAHRVTAAVPAGGGMQVEVKLEHGYRQRIALPGPAVISVSPQASALAEPSLPAWLHSRTAPIGAPPAATEAPQSVDSPAGMLSAPNRKTIGETEAAPTTTLRSPVPRVKRQGVLDPGLNAEERIRALVAAPTGGGGTVLPAAEGTERQADAIVDLLRKRGF